VQPTASGSSSNPITPASSHRLLFRRRGFRSLCRDKRPATCQSRDRTEWWVIVAMRQLMLLRHAKSSWDDKKVSDARRPLSERGREAAAAMTAAMRERGLVPDLVLVSPAQRTLETLAAFEPWEETPLIERMDELYLATAPQMLQVLHGVPETVRSVLLIGHNPGIHDLARTLNGARAMASSTPENRRLAERFPTAALAEFSIAGSWKRLGEGSGRLVRFLCPRDLTEKVSN